MPETINPKLKSWASDIDPGTIRQAEKTARLPIVEGRVALMPDAHVGIGATVGSVIPTRGAVIPSAVGVDIGCGMIAAELDATDSQLPDSLAPLLSRVQRAIPAGVGPGHDRAAGNAELWMASHHPATDLSSDQAGKALKQDPDLAWFTQGTPEFDAYITDMLWAQDYARANRDQMMDNAMAEVFAFLGFGVETRRVDCHHNFSQREVHGGRELWVTRKGAIKADKGDVGVIPGSMGTRSYIVVGKGNPDSWNSCSHGAGRRHSRSQARKLFTAADLTRAMAGKTWLAGRAKALIDEIPAAYKDIDQVMADQSDLVEVQHTLHQVLNYKGT